MSGNDSVSFKELYALSENRGETLKQLLRGSKEYYRYTLLHLIQTNEGGKNESLIKKELKAYLESQDDKIDELYKQMEARFNLSRFSQQKDQDEIWNWLKKTVGLSYNYSKSSSRGVRPSTYPSTLDQDAFSWEKQKASALKYTNRLQNFVSNAPTTTRLLDCYSSLSTEQQHLLLQRVAHPDHPNLMKLYGAVIADKNRSPTRFPIFSNLTKSQLEELAKMSKHHDMRNNGHWVDSYVKHLEINPDCDPNDIQVRTAYLNRLKDFVMTLSDAFMGHKVNVMYNILKLGIETGVYNNKDFTTYLQFPAQRSDGNVEMLKKLQSQAQKIINFGLPRVGSLRSVSSTEDSELCRTLLLHYLKGAESVSAFSNFFEDNYLTKLWVTSNLLAGEGDADKWFKTLNSPAYLAELKSRVDIEFDETNSKGFKTDEKVELKVWIKNVKTLLVKVYHINTFNYYMENNQEVTTGINLDGLVANHEFVEKYKEAPIKRVNRSFTFDKIKDRGMYVIEFIGGGKSSRAVVIKGQIKYIDRLTYGGHVFTFFDESDKPLSPVKMILSGHAFETDEDGEILVPFTSSKGEQNIILTHGGFTTLGRFNHKTESYSFHAGIYVDRETLLKGNKAQVVISPKLYINDKLCPISKLEDVTLKITTNDADGTESTKSVPKFELFADKDSTYEFNVPDGLRSITFQLTSSVTRTSDGAKQGFNKSSSFVINKIDGNAKTQDHILARDATGYVLEVIGRSGEPIPNEVVSVTLKSRFFSNYLTYSVQTDSFGKVQLGQLKDISSVTTQYTWNLPKNWHSYPKVISAAEGEDVIVPFNDIYGCGLSVKSVSLLEKGASGYVVRNCFDKIRLEDGYLKIKDLTQGKYSLCLKDNDSLTIAINVSKGKKASSFIFGKCRILEQARDVDVQVEAKVTEKALKITVHNSTERTRVHVLASHFLPSHNVVNSLAQFPLSPLASKQFTTNECRYLSGRKLGDEYRYILDRKYAKIYAGNTLPRPSMLLNPWAIQDTLTSLEVLRSNEKYGTESLNSCRSMAACAAPLQSLSRTKPSGLQDHNLDFLPQGSVVMYNLKVDDNGDITIPLEELKGSGYLRVVAIDDGSAAHVHVFANNGLKAYKDLRLNNDRALAADGHFTEQKKIDTVAPGSSFSVRDVFTSKIEIYDTKTKVFSLFTALTNNSTLDKFKFILNWKKMTEEEKREKYSEFSCHELNYFIYRCDEKFFKDVVKPYIANKKEKTFMDSYLLSLRNLKDFMTPVEFERLNTFEQILLGEALEDDEMANYVKAKNDLLPVQVDRFNRLFDTAVKGSALDADAPKLGGKDKPQAPQAMYRAAKLEVAAPMSAVPRSRKKSKRRKQSMQRKDRKEKEYKSPVVFHKSLPKTKEYAEMNYYKHNNTAPTNHLVSMNAFWRDYAQRDRKSSFVSSNVAYAANQFPEMMFALSVLDMPFTDAEEHDIEYNDYAMTLKPKNDVIIFHKQINESPVDRKPVLVGQNFYDPARRYDTVNGNRVERYVSEEFIYKKVYGCQLVVTNVSCSKQQLEVLMQIPVGSFPVSNGFFTKSKFISLGAYSTQTIDYQFYFPAPGSYKHFPVHVSQSEKVVAYAQPVTLKVVEKPTIVDTQSWDWISQNGTSEQVIEFLKKENVHDINTAKMAWRFKDADFFSKAISILAAQKAFSKVLWSFGVLHKDVKITKEYLQYNKTFMQRVGPYMTSPLLSLDPVRQRSYEHLEYNPFVNARAHAIGSKREILNDRFKAQYEKFLSNMCYVSMDASDLMAATYYLLIQDRIDESKAMFARVSLSKTDNNQAKLQYDYLAAYLDFYNDEPKVAREVVKKYVDYPVPRWNKLFGSVRQKLAEIDGASVEIVDEKSRDQQQAKLASAQASFDFTVESKKIHIDYQNLKNVTVSFFKMDIELLFSTSPFVQKATDQFGYIMSNSTISLELPAHSNSHVIDLPEAYHNSNVMIDIQAAGTRKSSAYFSNSLFVNIIENYGQLKVTDKTTGRPISKVYIKVYARHTNGTTKFFKDGYTDLSGAFDYTSVMTNDLNTVDRFSILVMSEKNGSLIKEANKPKQ